MKRVIGLVILAGAAVVGYRWLQMSGAVSAYEKFAEAWILGDQAQAMKFADASTATRAIEKQSLRGLRSGAIVEAFRGTSYEIASTARTPEGDVVLEVKQTIQFDPPGVTSGVTGA